MRICLTNITTTHISWHVLTFTLTTGTDEELFSNQSQHFKSSLIFFPPNSGTASCWNIWVFPKIMVPPTSSILMGFSIINHPFWGVSPYFRKHPYPINQWSSFRPFGLSDSLWSEFFSNFNCHYTSSPIAKLRSGMILIINMGLTYSNFNMIWPKIAVSWNCRDPWFVLNDTFTVGTCSHNRRLVAFLQEDSGWEVVDMDMDLSKCPLDFGLATWNIEDEGLA